MAYQRHTNWRRKQDQLVLQVTVVRSSLKSIPFVSCQTFATIPDTLITYQGAVSCAILLGDKNARLFDKIKREPVNLCFLFTVSLSQIYFSRQLRKMADIRTTRESARIINGPSIWPSSGAFVDSENFVKKISFLYISLLKSISQ